MCKHRRFCLLRSTKIIEHEVDSLPVVEKVVKNNIEEFKIIGKVSKTNITKLFVKVGEKV